MAVWARLRIEAALPGYPARVLEAKALANTGHRADIRHLSLPAGAAERIGYWPSLPPQAVRIDALGFGGKKTEIFGIPAGVRLRVMVSDRQRTDLLCACVVAPEDDEIILSDALVGGLGLVILDAEQGLWCFRDELGRVERPSEPPQAW